MLSPCSPFIPSAVWYVSRLPRSTLLQLKPRRESSTSHTSSSMDEEKLPSLRRKQATTRICIVSSFSTELLEMHSEEPSLHILFIPGNPGIVSFYKDFVEAIYELLEGNASITAIGHISHTRKDWERGRMFSLQEQINHKVDFIKQEFQSSGPPVILVGHSIGSYICLEIFKSLPQVVSVPVNSLETNIKSCEVCYRAIPIFDSKHEFLKAVHDWDDCKALSGLISNALGDFLYSTDVLELLQKTHWSSILSASISYFVSLLGSFPTWASSALVKRLLGQSWSATAVDAACSHLMHYHTMRNVLFMAMTEFTELSDEPDWTFMKKQQDQIALLFGIDDHWGPLSFFEEVSRQVPGIALSIEQEGHTHAYCCTEAGSIWVARHVATLIRSRIPN